MGCATARPTVNERTLETKANSGQEIEYESCTERTLLYARRLADPPDPPEYTSNDHIQHGNSEDEYNSNDKVESTNKDLAFEANNNGEKLKSNVEVEDSNNGQVGDICNGIPEHDGKERAIDENEGEDHDEVTYREKTENTCKDKDDRCLIDDQQYSESQTEICYLDKVLCAKVKSDRNPPSVQDIAVVHVEGIQQILMADDSNDCLKLFVRRKDRDQFQSVLNLTSSPFQITVLKDALSVAVTLPLQRQILVVSLSKALKLKSKLELEKEYFGLVALSDSEVACGAPLEYPPCIDIIDFDGQVLSSFSTADNYGGLFADVSFISKTPEGLLLIVDPKDHVLVCASTSGLIVWRYEPRWKEKLVSPAGVVCDDDGRVYLADASRRVIVQLSQDGHKMTELPFSSMPHAVSFCHGILYISAKSGHFSEVSK